MEQVKNRWVFPGFIDKGEQSEYLWRADSTMHAAWQTAGKGEKMLWHKQMKNKGRNRKGDAKNKRNASKQEQ